MTSLRAAKGNLLLAAEALMAFRRGEETEEAELGALLIADHFATVDGAVGAMFKQKG